MVKIKEEEVDKRKKNHKDIGKLTFGKWEKQIELDEVAWKVQGYERQIIESDYSYRTVRRLVQAIKKEHNIPGFKGLLIDFIKPGNSGYSALLDISLKQRMFTLITETSKEA